MKRLSIMLGILVLLTFLLTPAVFCSKKTPVPPEEEGMSREDLSMSLVIRGRDLLDQNKRKEALDCFRKASASNPKNVEALFFEGMTLYLMDDFEKADRALDAALKLSRDFYQIWYFKGKVANAQKKRQEALGCFEKALELKPDFVDAWYSKGMLMFAHENYSQCIASMLRVRALDPNHAGAWVFTGMSEYWLGRYDSAKESIQKGLSLNPALKSNIPDEIRKELKIP